MVRFAIALAAAALGGVLAALPLGAAAQSGDPYPSRPVKILVPYAPGGATDIIARHVANRLPEVLGQSVVVENRAGASGNIALEAAAKAPADGYTVLCGNVSTNAINETTFAHSLQTKPSRDLVGVTKLVEIPHVIIANPTLPANSVAELIALAKQSPGKLNYASAGLGTYPHLDMVKLMGAAGIDMVHVPYRGGGPAVADLVAGQVPLAVLGSTPLIPHHKSGRIKILAFTSKDRFPTLPDIPTLHESGFPGFDTGQWLGLLAPRGTAVEIVNALYAETRKALALADVRERLLQSALLPVGNTPQEFATVISADIERWTRLANEAGVKPQ